MFWGFFFKSDWIALLLISCFGSENSEIPISCLVNSDIKVKTPLEVGGDQNRVDEMVKTATNQS